MGVIVDGGIVDKLELTDIYITVRNTSSSSPISRADICSSVFHDVLLPLARQVVK